MTQNQVLIIDACSVLNLYASRWMQDILGSTHSACHIASIVRQESQFVLKGGSGEDASEPELIDFTEILQSAILSIADLESEEEALLFIDLSTRLDDGEAMTIALAVIRGWTVVTDDRKAGRVSLELGVPVLSSIELVSRWAAENGVADSVLRSCLGDIRHRARWEPRRNDPLRSWWDQLMTS